MRCRRQARHLRTQSAQRSPTPRSQCMSLPLSLPSLILYAQLISILKYPFEELRTDIPTAFRTPLPLRSSTPPRQPHQASHPVDPPDPAIHSPARSGRTHYPPSAPVISVKRSLPPSPPRPPRPPPPQKRPMQVLQRPMSRQWLLMRRTWRCRMVYLE